MCGIAGAFYKEEKDSFNAFNFTANAIKDIIYRGPDDNETVERNNICLGSCRLAINDTREIANMPMESECSRYLLVFNGEIYNYRELRENLVGQFSFKTSSDTEVVLNSFIKYGTSCFDKFEGMFALAIWDELEKKLILARDRLGKKPLFYFQNNNYLFFCSELNPLKKASNNLLKINNSFLEEIAIFGEQSINKTAYKNIFRISPNSFCEISILRQEIKKKNYKYKSIFQLDNFERNSKTNLYDTLLKATRVRLLADRPVAIALSGGTDSAVLCKLISDLDCKKPPAFTLRFHKKDIEVTRAAKVAKKYKLDHHIIDYKDDESYFFNILKSIGEPYCDPAIAYLSYISKSLPKEIKVLLTGDGGDEAFLGYSKYAFSFYYSKIPFLIRKLICSIQPNTYNSTNKLIQTIANRIHIMNVYSSSNMKNLELNYISFLKPYLSYKTLLGLQMIIEERSKRYSFDNQFNSLYKNYCIHDITSRLPGRYLPKVDLAGAYNSVEIRSPYLDDVLLSQSMNKMLRGDNKLLNKPFLKNILLQDFPKSFVFNKKKGFSPTKFLLSKNLIETSLYNLKSKNLSLTINELSDAFLKNPGLRNHWCSKSIIWNLICINSWYS